MVNMGASVARSFGIFAVILMLCLPGCNIKRQWHGPGCVDQTVARSGRQNGSIRGSIVILDDGHSYENLGLEHEWINGIPWSLGVGDRVVVCPGRSPGIYEISFDEIGTGFHQFRRR